MYWAQAMATQTVDSALAAQFKPLADALTSKEETIVSELNGAQGASIEMEGYYFPNTSRLADAMRPK